MTIRLRLSLLFTVLVSFLLIVFSFVVYALLSVARARDFDEILLSRALAAGIVALEHNEVDSLTYQATVRSFERSGLADEQIVVYSPNDKIVFTNDSLPQEYNKTRLHVNFTAIRQARAGKTLRFLDTLSAEAMHSNISWFLTVKPLTMYVPYDDENERFVVVIHAFDTEGAQIQSDTAWILLFAVLSSVLIVFGAGWIFAVRTLAPVEEMTRLAEDISAKDLEKRLPEGNGRDELAHLARAFNAMFIRLEQSFTAQKHFVAHASHEMRTPLTSVIGEIGVVLDQPRTEIEYQSTLESVLSTALQMRQMASDLLQLARVESGIWVQDFTDCAIDEILLTTVEQIQQAYTQRLINTTIALQSYRSTYKGNGINLGSTTNTPVDEVDNDKEFVVRGNMEILRLIIINIIDNALKYSPPDTLVHVHLQRLGNACIVTITDSGAGISEEEQSVIFEPFYRSDRTRETPGTGIGLAFVARAVSLHQGTISLKSQENVGTCVTLSFPAIE